MGKSKYVQAVPTAVAVHCTADGQDGEGGRGVQTVG